MSVRAPGCEKKNFLPFVRFFHATRRTQKGRKTKQVQPKKRTNFHSINLIHVFPLWRGVDFFLYSPPAHEKKSKEKTKSGKLFCASDQRIFHHHRYSEREFLLLGILSFWVGEKEADWDRGNFRSLFHPRQGGPFFK